MKIFLRYLKIMLFVLILVAVLLWLCWPEKQTQSVLTLEDLIVYNECIEFLQAHDDQKQVIWMKVRKLVPESGHVLYEDRIFTGDVCKKLSDPSIKVKKKLGIVHKPRNDSITESLLSDYKIRMKEKSKRPYGVNCMRFYRWNDFVMFYKHSPGLVDCYKGPGVLYSLDGRNPNDVEDKVINAYKPFIKIRDNWYTSRHLMLQGPRHVLNHSSLPKSLFDSSLKIN